MRLLGRVVATRNQGSFEETVKKYENRLLLALRRPPRCGSNINVLMHSLGYFSKRLSRDEKRFFLGSLRKYKEGHIPLSILITIVRSWAIRFEEDYLLNQTLFEPYPEDLINKDAFTTYCDGKDYWK
jgi:uncharacterized protein YbgA (DUF1722 family)